VLRDADATRALALRQHYAQAAHAAAYALDWAARRGWPNGESIAMAALLHNPAALVLAGSDPEAALRALNASRSGVPWQIAYGAELGHDVRGVNAQLCAKYGLPRVVGAALRHDAAPSPAARLAALAGELGRVTLCCWHADELTLHGEALARSLDIEPDRAVPELSRTAVDAARELAPLGYPTAAFDLLRLSGDAVLDAEEEARLEQVLARQARRAAQTARADPRRVTQVAITGALRGMLQEAGAARSVFFMLTRDRRTLRARLALGMREDDPLRQLEIALTRRHLFERLLAKPQSVWVRPANRQKYNTLLPEELRVPVPEANFFAMSLIVSNRPLGLFFADGPALCDAGYRRFRALCAEAGVAVAGNHGAP